MKRTLILLRHGESLWNRENRFTGWTDVGLSERGVEEAHGSAKLLADAGYTFDCTHSSLLERAIFSLQIVLEDMHLSWLPVQRSWRLNERHYGALQGLNKRETASQFGNDQVFLWRRSYHVPPPALDDDDPRHPRFDTRYRFLTRDLLPTTESLEDVVHRCLPYWHDAIVPQLLDHKTVFVAAHGNSLRALVKHIDGISDDDVVNLHIPTGVPLVYELDDGLAPTAHFYLGDPETVRKAAAAVAAQSEPQA